MRSTIFLPLFFLGACQGSSEKTPDAPVQQLELCDDAYAPQQLRLLSRREYDHTVRDLTGLSVDVPCVVNTDCNVASDSCMDAVCAPDPCEVNTFTLSWSGATTVVVAGSFNDWASTEAAGAWPMTYAPDQDIWFLKKQLPAGEHQYKFVIDQTQWHHDASNPWTTSDGHGGFNSVVNITCDGSEIAEPDTPSALFPTESRPSGWHYDNHASSGVVTSSHATAYLDAAGEVAQHARQVFDEIVPCNPTEDSCIDTFVSTFGRRAFRRPLLPEEQARYTALARQEDDPQDGITLALEAMLSSPVFLYRSEVGTSDDNQQATLDAYEIATSLSFFLWGTTPDDDLLAKAESGGLGSTADIEATALAMLDDPRARDHFGDFATQWLGVERVLTVDKNPALFPTFHASVRQAALAETRRAFTHELFDGEASLTNFLTSDTHFVNEATAPLYGLDDITGPELRPVTVSDRPQAGILGHVSVLAATAYSDQTSPVRRGLFVREHLLCQHLGTPPPDAGGIPTIDPSGTTRERFERHSADPTCAACHQYIDPIGFGFEHYDPIGRWRDLDGGLPIQADGEVVDPEMDGGGDAIAFSTLGELTQTIAQSRAVRTCFTREMYRFATGWEPPHDDCELTKLADEFADGELNIRQLLVRIATSPVVLRRNLEQIQ